MPSIRSGFPVVIDNSGAAAPYTITTAAFSANAGDELCAIVMGGGLPVVVSRNSSDTGPGVLKWLRRFVTRVDFTTATTNVSGAQQVAIYTAIVPPGGITERASFTTSLVVNDGGAAASPNNLPARLVVIAVDGTNGVGAVGWRGSIKTGPGGSNDITTGLAATQTLKPMGDDSLILGGGWFVDGSTPNAAAGCTEVVAPGAIRMPIWSRIAGVKTVDVAVGSSVTDSTLWALGLIEYLSSSSPKPPRKLFCFGDSGIESTSSARQTAVVVQDTLAPQWEIFNYGVWYAHTDQTLNRWNSDSPDFPELSAAIIQVGFNDITDIGGGTAWPSASETNVASLYGDLDTLGVPLACYTGIGPLATPGVAPAGYYDFRDWVTANAPAGTHLYSLDLVTDPGAGYLAVLAANSAADGQHISAAGNTITGANISAWVNTLGLVAINSHPVSRIAGNGSTATFSVTATNATSYQWQDDSTGSFADISGATSSTYALTASLAISGRKFRCKVGNGSDVLTSIAALLTVVSAPKMHTPYERLPRGGDDVWDQAQASVVLLNDVFPSEGSMSPLGLSLSVVVSVAGSISAGLSTAISQSGSVGASIDAVVQSTRNATASLNVAVQQALTSITNLQTAVQATGTQSASLNAAIQAALTAIASIDTVVADIRTNSASMQAAVQAAATLATQLSTAVALTTAQSTSVQAAVQEARSATAAIQAAVLETRTASVGVQAGVQDTRSASASVDTAVQDAKSAATSISAGVQVGDTVTTSLNAVLQATLSAAASIDAVVQETKQAATSVQAAVLATTTSQTNISAQVQADAQQSAQLNAGVQDTHAASTQFDAAVQLALSTATAVNAMVQEARLVSASIESAVRETKTAQTTLDAMVQGGQSQSANTQAAVQEGKTGSTSLNAALQLGRAGTTSIDAATQVQRTAGVGIDTAAQEGHQTDTAINTVVELPRSTGLSLDAQILASNAHSTSLSAYILSAFSVASQIDAAIREAKTASSVIDAGVQIARLNTASIQAALQEVRSESVSLNAQVQAGSTQTTAVDLAVQQAFSAVIALSVAVTEVFTVNVGLQAAVAETFSGVTQFSAAVQYARNAQAGFSIYVDDPSLAPVQEREVYVDPENREIFIEVDDREIDIPSEEREIRIPTEEEMKSAPWIPPVFHIHSGATLDYLWKWGDWLAAIGDAIETFEVIPGDGVTVVSQTQETSSVRGFLQADPTLTKRKSTIAHCKIVTVGLAGAKRTDIRDIIIHIRPCGLPV